MDNIELPKRYAKLRGLRKRISSKYVYSFAGRFPDFKQQREVDDTLSVAYPPDVSVTHFCSDVPILDKKKEEDKWGAIELLEETAKRQARGTRNTFWWTQQQREGRPLEAPQARSE